MKNEDISQQLRSRKIIRRKQEKKHGVEKPVFNPKPWPEIDTTPRNGECNVAPNTFAILPNDGKKMFEWMKKDPDKK